MFNWFWNLFNVKPKRFAPKRNKICGSCGRKYGTFNAAVVCSDWDKTLGKQRHLKSFNEQRV